MKVLSMTFFVSALCLQLGLADSESRGGELQGAVLVKASVTGITDYAEQGAIAHLRVERAYCGTRGLTDVSLSCGIASTGGDTTGAGIFPPPHVGAEGIFALRLAGGNWRPVFFSVYGRRWPAWQGTDRRFSQAESLAEVIGALHDLSNLRRTEALSEYVISSIPEIARWATEEMLHHSPEDAMAALTQGSVPCTTLPVASRLVVDEALVRQRGELWAFSEERYALLESVMKSPLDEFEQMMVIQRLRQLAMQGDVSHQRCLFDVIDRAARNENVSVALRQRCLRALALLRDPGARNAGTDLLIEQAAGEDIQTAGIAASVLKSMGGLTEEQQLRLRAIVESTRSVAVREALQDVLQQ